MNDHCQSRCLRCDLADTTARYVLIPQASRARAFDAVIGEVSLDRRGIWRGIVAGAGRPNFGDLLGKRGAAPLAKRLDLVAEREGPRPPG